MRGNHGALDRHAVILDLVSRNSRMNKNTKNVMMPTHVEPIWTCQAGNLFIFCHPASFASPQMLSTVISAQAPPNNATSNVVGL
jgi:hypothetical protein